MAKDGRRVGKKSVKEEWCLRRIWRNELKEMRNERKKDTRNKQEEVYKVKRKEERGVMGVKRNIR